MLRSFSLPVNILQSAATAAASLVWAMRNTDPYRAAYIRRAVLNVMFNGTAAATSSAYQFVRFRTATPTTGTALVPIPVNGQGASPAIASIVGDARFLDTGLAIVGVTFDASFGSMGNPRSVTGTVTQYPRDFGDGQDDLFVLPPGDGLGIILGATAVVGDGIQGHVDWYEREQGR
jgi:hypothetical protein